MGYFSDYSPASLGRYWPLRGWLLAHIAGGTIALFTGPFQLWSGLRGRLPRVHRATGYAYVGGVLLGGASSFYLAFRTLPDFGVSLFFLGVAWWLSVGMAFLAIRNRRVNAHKEWMIRGYIVTFAFVTFRFLVDLPVFDTPGQSRLATVGWMCWVIPLLVAEVLFHWKSVRPRRRRVIPNGSIEST